MAMDAADDSGKRISNTLSGTSTAPTPRTSIAWGERGLAEELLWRSNTYVKWYIDGTCTLTSGSRAARGRAEPFRRAIHRAVIDGTYTDERYVSNTGTGATSRSSTLSVAHRAA